MIKLSDKLSFNCIKFYEFFTSCNYKLVFKVNETLKPQFSINYYYSNIFAW